jgi:hypothetical protein
MEVPHVSSIPEFQGLGDLGIGEKRFISTVFDHWN